MPLKHLRVCEPPCNRIRFAECNNRSCALPIASDDDSWRENMQHGAGTNGAKENA